MEDSGLLTYVSEADVRSAIEAAFPGTKEIPAASDEDLLFEHQTDGVADKHFQVWKYTHPAVGELWVVNMVDVVDFAE
jgi:hypothetical protein